MAGASTNETYECKSVREIRFEEGSELKKIGDYAFKGLYLSELVLPKSFQDLRSYMFQECQIGTLRFEVGSELRAIQRSVGKIGHLVIPENVESIDASYVQKVNKISVDPMNSHFSADDHFLFNTDQTRLIFMFDMNLVDVVIPKHVQVLCSKCFSKRKQVRSISFENGSELRVIESYALRDTSISRFVVPCCVKKIEDNAFSGCSLLREIVFEDDCVLRHLSCGMFEDTHLRHLSISSNVETIEANCLLGIEQVDICVNNSHLTKESPEFLRGCGIRTLGRVVDKHLFVFDASTEEIPSNEFRGCQWLERVSFSGCDRIRSIWKSVFRESHLQSIDIPALLLNFLTNLALRIVKSWFLSLSVGILDLHCFRPSCFVRAMSRLSSFRVRSVRLEKNVFLVARCLMCISQKMVVWLLFAKVPSRGQV